MQPVPLKRLADVLSSPRGMLRSRPGKALTTPTSCIIQKEGQPPPAAGPALRLNLTRFAELANKRIILVVTWHAQTTKTSHLHDPCMSEIKISSATLQGESESHDISGINLLTFGTYFRKEVKSQ